jgi:hypothetical protein
MEPMVVVQFEQTLVEHQTTVINSNKDHQVMDWFDLLRIICGKMFHPIND